MSWRRGLGIISVSIYTEAAMRSLRSTMEILSRDVPRVFQVRI
jgi:hypothetical protein